MFKLPMLRHDLANHFVYGGVLAIVAIVIMFGANILGLLTPAVYLFTPVVATTFVSIAALIKEKIDGKGYGTTDSKDFYWTVLGSVPVSLAFYFGSLAGNI